jgi:hypothetical protein
VEEESVEQLIQKKKTITVEDSINTETNEVTSKETQNFDQNLNFFSETFMSD